MSTSPPAEALMTRAVSVLTFIVAPEEWAWRGCPGSQAWVPQGACREGRTDRSRGDATGDAVLGLRRLGSLKGARLGNVKPVGGAC